MPFDSTKGIARSCSARKAWATVRLGAGDVAGHGREPFRDAPQLLLGQPSEELQGLADPFPEVLLLARLVGQRDVESVARNVRTVHLLKPRWVVDVVADELNAKAR